VTTTRRLELHWIEGEYAVCRLDPHARLSAMPRGPFMSITRTVDELSVVCLAEEAPEGSRVEGPYALMRVAGSMVLGVTGVLASLAAPLAAAQISIFAVATFDTDYLLVRTADRTLAEATLVAAGHRFRAG
jgi:hypothetical protein